ncbi:PQQ-binding-like beta-propeller repeat protein [Halobacillus litoralis]|uniref:outer membrane protein assembly factor BamB family protein n=1 Tax=Halobacillus litoralis TaxID=45668 RepID=UPI001CFE2AA1|nr:PQQ-binding-like beta-propeller repeat protein [Halobacillus litoralis]
MNREWLGKMKFFKITIVFMLCTLLLFLVSGSVLAKGGKTGSSSGKGEKSTELSALEEGGFLDSHSGRINPNQAVSREDYVKILVKASNLPLTMEKTTTFKDLSHVYSLPYIHTAVENGWIIPEEFHEKFQPQKSITKLESAVMIARLLDLNSSTEELLFKDEKKVKEHRSLVKAAFDAGYIPLHNNGKFQPNKPITYQMLNAQVYQLKEDLNHEMDEAVADVTYMENVKNVGDHFLYNLVKITEDGEIQLKKDENLEDYKVGDILSIPSLEEYPEGLSLKVTGVKETEDLLIIQTEDPAFEEIFSEVDLDFTKSVTPDDLVTEEGIEVEAIPISEEEQGPAIRSLRSSANASITGYEYLFKFDKSLMEYEQDDESASLRLEGEFFIEGPTLSVSTVYENFFLKSGSIDLYAKQSSELHLKGDVAADYERSIKLATIKFPIKNAFSAEVILSLKVTASGQGYLEVGLEEAAEADTGVRIVGEKDDRGIIKYKKTSTKPRSDLRVQVNPVEFGFEGTAAAGPTLDLNVKYNQLSLISSENAAGVMGKVKKDGDGPLCLKTGRYITSDIVWKFIVYEEFPMVDPTPKWNETCLGIEEPDPDPEPNPEPNPEPENPLESELLWTRTEIGVPSEVKIGPEGNLYYTESGGTFVSLNPDGELRWERKRPLFFRSPVVTQEGEIFVENSDGVMAYDLDNNPLWSSPQSFELGDVKGNMAMLDDLLIVPVSSNFSNDKGASVYAVTKEGEIVWGANLIPEGGGVSISDVEVSHGHAFVVADGSLYKIDPRGEVEVLLKDHYLRRKPEVAEDGTVYVLSSVRRKLYAVSPNGQNSGEEGVLWSVSTDYLSSNHSEPRIAPNGKIYINGADKITIIDPGKEKIEAFYGVEYQTSPVTFDESGNTYVASHSSMTDTSSIVVFDDQHNRLSSYVSEGVSGRLGGPLTLGGNGIVYSPGMNLFAVKFYNIEN